MALPFQLVLCLGVCLVPVISVILQVKQQRSVDRKAIQDDDDARCSQLLGRTWPFPDKVFGKRYDLFPGAATILDIGGNIGRDISRFLDHHAELSIETYEPIPSFNGELHRKFGNDTRVKIHNYGFADADQNATFALKGEHGVGTSGVDRVLRTADGVVHVEVQLRDADKILNHFVEKHGAPPDALNINCEGCEYAVLLRLMETGWFRFIPFIQVSWHVVDGVKDRKEKRCLIETGLWANYDPVYSAGNGWVGWQLRS